MRSDSRKTGEIEVIPEYSRSREIEEKSIRRRNREMQKRSKRKEKKVKKENSPPR